VINTVVWGHGAPAQNTRSKSGCEGQDFCWSRSWDGRILVGTELRIPKCEHHNEGNDIRDPSDTLIPVDQKLQLVFVTRDNFGKLSPVKKSITKKGYLLEGQHAQGVRRNLVRTTREMTLMITMPKVSSKCELTLARVCPPMMQFRIKKPCIENTLRAEGIIDP
jgi:hypothetical protein